ncbi:hypothetical protein GY45DRAFT_1356329 [Cubamyces sp. BRFM 1775]|nr:hypothetical protein GY45DRAFT_1356329 [Cubamyces sp. BRFM 1775]
MLILLPGESEKAPAVPPKGSAAPVGLSWLNPAAPEELPPPPYSPPAPQPGPSSPSLPQPQRTFSSAFTPQAVQTVNHFELFSKHNPIAGTYLIDPLLPTPGFTAGGLRKLRKKGGRAWGKSACPNDIHASFRTRHAPINLDLAAVAESEGSSPSLASAKVPTCIVVSSRHGRINLNLVRRVGSTVLRTWLIELLQFEIQPGRSIDLNVETRHGKIVLLLPPTYDGPLMFHTRYASSVTFLPEFAARTRTLRATDRETLVVCTAPSASGAPSMPMPTPSIETATGDRVLVRTRHGRVIVGISGLDRVEDAAVNGNLFQKLGELFEVGGKLLGRYVEGHASALERKLTEKSAVLTRALDDMKAVVPEGRAAPGNK